jgi:Methylamine utilisation protein MauE
VSRGGNRESGIGNRRARLFLRNLVGLVLVATAVGKLLDLPGFERILSAYRVFPEGLLLAIGAAVVLAELALALWLISGRRPFSAAVAGVVLHLAYAAWAASALLRGLRLPNCGCFGVFFPRRLSWSTVAEDLALAGICAALAGLSRSARSIEPA